MNNNQPTNINNINQVSNNMSHNKVPAKNTANDDGDILMDSKPSAIPKPSSLQERLQQGINNKDEWSIPRKQTADEAASSSKKRVHQDEDNKVFNYTCPKVSPPKPKKAKKLTACKVYTLPEPVQGAGAGKRMYLTFVILLPCLEDNIVIIDPINPQTGNQAWMQPFIQIIQQDPLAALDFHIISVCSRRDPEVPELDMPLPKNPGSPYPKRAVILFNDPNVSVDQFLMDFCLRWSHRANTERIYTGDRNQFVYKPHPGKPYPVNHYLRNRDTILLLKKVYGTEGVTKSDVESDEDVLIKFFGDVDTGRQLLSNLTEDQWENISS